MADWTTNTIMTWDGDKVSDHGREALSVSTERIGTDRRMANGTLRRHFVKNKRTWSLSWNNLPSRNDVTGGMTTADGGMSGREMEDFYNANPGKFRMVLRTGSAINETEPVVTDAELPFEDDNFYMANVMITEFSHEVLKRGMVDLWSASVTLEEV